MNPEELKKILENVEMSVEDKLKAISDLHEADKKGIALKNQELIGAEKKLKDTITATEKKLNESNAKVVELEAEMKKNNPEDRQKYYDAKIKELEDKHMRDVEGITKERDKYKESHLARIKNDAIAAGIKDLKLIPALKDAFVALVMSQNDFRIVEVDGKTEFVTDSNKSIEMVMRDFAVSTQGKAFIENQNSGAGSAGASTNNAGAGTGGTQVTREQFDAMSPAARTEFVNKGGKVVKP